MLTLVPSIVVYNNGSGGGMDRQHLLKSRLSKQDEFEEMDEDVSSAIESCAIIEGNNGPTLDTEESMAKDEFVICTEDEYDDNDNRSSSKDLGFDEPTSIIGDEVLDSLTVNLQATTINCNNSRNCAPNKCKGKEKTTDSIAPHSRHNSRHRSHSKVKLLQRSHALRDDASPPPSDYITTTSEIIPQVNTLSVSAATILTTQTKVSSGRHRLGKQGSSHSTGSLDESSPALSRESSLEQYTDSTGTDLQQFIITTLHKNQKDRMFLLKIEQDLNSLVKEISRQQMKFPSMTAYQRMLVHRVAAFFGLDHNVDPTGTCVIVNKTKNTRLPDMKFRDQIRDELIPEEPKKSILKRDSSSFDDGKDARSPERQFSSESRRSKSFEEREEEYGKARARIFNQDSSSSQEGAMESPASWSRSYEGTHNSSRRSSQEDLRWQGEPKPWSSTDSESSNRPSKLVITKTSASTESEFSSSGASGRAPSKESSDGTPINNIMLNTRKHIPKASSFGGISVLTRDDSITSTKSSSPRLTKAESFNSTSTSCISPITRVIENIDYETTSNTVSEAQITPLKATVSTSTTSVSVVSSATSPIAAGTPNFSSPTPTSSANRYHLLSTQSPMQQGQQVMWAVSNMDSVPTGSVIINPQTGQPYYNSDGSIYRHNPSVAIMQPYLSNNQSIQYQLQTLQQPQQSINLSSQGPTPAQTSVFICAPTPLNNVVEQRSFITDNGGIATSVMDVYPRLSNSSLPGNYTTSETQLIGGGDGLVHLQPPTPTNNPFHPSNAYSVPVPRPNTLPINQMPQSSLSQLPLVLVSPHQTMQYFSPVSYIGNTPQVAPMSGQLTHTLESQQQVQQSLMNELPMMNSMTVPAQSFQGVQCVQSLTPSIGQTQLPNYMSPYISVSTQSQPPVTNASVPLSAYSAFSVAPVVNSNAFSNNCIFSTANPSQTSNLVSGPVCNNSNGMLNTGGLQMVIPPSAIPPNYYQTQTSFRPQTPPNNPPRMLAAGQQNLGLVPGLSRSYALTPNGVNASSCSNYNFYTPPVPSTPPQAQSINFQQQNSVNVHQQQQQSVQSSASQTTQLQYSQFAPQMMANLQFFRPNMQLMVRPNTPPSVSIIPGSSSYNTTASAAAPYLNPKSYNLQAVVDQRFMKTSDVYLVDAIGSNGIVQKGPQNQSVLPQPIVTSNTGIRPGTPNRSFSLLHGDVRLIGTPLQHHLQAPVRVPMMFPHQRPLARMQSFQHCMGSRPPRVKRQSRSRPGGNKVDNLTSIGNDQGS